MASEHDRWIDVELDEETEDVPSEAVVPDDNEDDVELHGQFFHEPSS